MSGCFVGSSSLLQSRRVIEMRPHTGRKIRNDRAETFQPTLGRMHLREPERYKIHTSERYCTSWNTSNNAIPTRTLATMLLQYHQKEMLVTRSTSFTGLGRFPCIHIQMKFTRNTPETAKANASNPCCAARRRAGGIKGPPAE